MYKRKLYINRHIPFILVEENFLCVMDNVVYSVNSGHLCLNGN